MASALRKKAPCGGARPEDSSADSKVEFAHEALRLIIPDGAFRPEMLM